MFICEKDSHCIDCPKNYSDEQCEHWIEVKPVRHGRWIREDKEYTRCSLCGNVHHDMESYGYYCQHCGAKMDEVEKELRE